MNDPTRESAHADEGRLDLPVERLAQERAAAFFAPAEVNRFCRSGLCLPSAPEHHESWCRRYKPLNVRANLDPTA